MPHLPGTVEYNLVNRIQQVVPLKIVIGCPYATDEHMLLAFSLGASSCIASDIPASILARTLQAAGNSNVSSEYNMLSKFELSRQVKAKLRSMPPAAPAANTNPLTRREQELLLVVSRGYSNQEICELLHIQEQTVKNHVSSILRKTRSRDRFHASANALRNGWVSLRQLAWQKSTR
jgi:DNA-binding NarL/FixJ family response regulator